MRTAPSCTRAPGWGRSASSAASPIQNPDVTDPLLNPDFKTSYMILGGEWFARSRAKVYTESKIDLDTVSATGASGGSVFTIGFRYDFSWRIGHR